MASEGGREDRGVPPGAREIDADHLRRVLEKLGLTEYESRVLIALALVGEATASQIATIAKVSRPNVYLRLDSLESKGLAYRHHGKVSRWSSPGRDEILERLWVGHQERLVQAQIDAEAHVAEARHLLDGLGPENAKTAVPEVQVITNDIQIGLTYERLLTEAAREIIVCNKGPYYGEVSVAPEVLDALERGVTARALYPSEELAGDEGPFLRQTWDVYEEAGVEGRVAEEVPVSLAMFDRQTVLVSLPARNADANGEIHLVIDHPEFATWCLAAFEHVWSISVPYSVVDLREDSSNHGNSESTEASRT